MAVVAAVVLMGGSIYRMKLAQGDGDEGNGNMEQDNSVHGAATTSIASELQADDYVASSGDLALSCPSHTLPCSTYRDGAGQYSATAATVCRVMMQPTHTTVILLAMMSRGSI